MTPEVTQNVTEVVYPYVSRGSLRVSDAKLLKDELTPLLTDKASDTVVWMVGFICNSSAVLDRMVLHDHLASLLATGGERERILVLLHGIRTHADWFEKVRSRLEGNRFLKVVPIRYGYFDAFRFWFPFHFREKPVAKVERELRSLLRQHPAGEISVIAHSYGTWILSRLVTNCPDLKFSNVILSGCIIPQDFRWDAVAHCFVGHVVNDCGHKDIWPILAKGSTWGFGSSGVNGFGSAYVRDRFHHLSHSGFFTDEFVDNFWSPLMLSDEVVTPEFEKNRPQYSLLLRSLNSWLSVKYLVFPFIVLVVAVACFILLR